MTKIETIATIKDSKNTHVLLKLGNQYALAFKDKFQALKNPEDHWADFNHILWHYNAPQTPNWLVKDCIGRFFLTENASSSIEKEEAQDPKNFTYWVINARFSFLQEVNYNDLDKAQPFIDNKCNTIQDATLYYASCVEDKAYGLEDWRDFNITTNGEAAAEELFFATRKVPKNLISYIDTYRFFEELIDDGLFVEFVFENGLYICTNASDYPLKKTPKCPPLLKP